MQRAARTSGSQFVAIHSSLEEQKGIHTPPLTRYWIEWKRHWDRSWKHGNEYRNPLIGSPYLPRKPRDLPSRENHHDCNPGQTSMDDFDPTLFSFQTKDASAQPLPETEIFDCIGIDHFAWNHDWDSWRIGSERSGDDPSSAFRKAHSIARRKESLARGKE